jgi:hypothetical protein
MGVVMAFDVEAFMQRQLTELANPSKRQNRHRSGRAGRRAALARVTIGRVSEVAAIYDGPDRYVYTEENGPPPSMCQVLEEGEELKVVTTFGATVSPYTPTGPYSYVGRVASV